MRIQYKQQTASYFSADISEQRSELRTLQVGHKYRQKYV